MANKKSKSAINRYQRELLGIIQRIASDQALLNYFLVDLLTPAEYEEVAIRWQIIRQLNRDAAQRDIMKNLGVAAATVTRGARMLLNPDGGFNRTLRRIS